MSRQWNSGASLILSFSAGDSTPDALAGTPTIFSSLEARLPSLFPVFSSLSSSSWEREGEGPSYRMPETTEKSQRYAFHPHGNGERPKLEIGRVKLTREQDPGLGKSSEGQVRAPPACGPWRDRGKGERVQGGTESKNSNGIRQIPRPHCCSFFLALHFLDLSVPFLDPIVPL